MTAILTNLTDDATSSRQAIRAASQATGAGFDYLVTTAERESSLNPRLRSRDSSAAGLFQFVDQTWLSMLKNYGPSLGYGTEAAAISRTEGGYAVGDPAMRRHIMNLRYDPQANALMAGAFTQQNKTYLQETLGRSPNAGELYIAHFLGAQGAAKFITDVSQAPNAPAASLFPDAAGANPSIFYAHGHTRTVGEVYAQLVSHHQSTPLEAQKIAARIAPASPAALPPQSETGSLFRNLFTAQRQGGVSPVVQALWTRHDGQSPNPVPVMAVASRGGFFPMSARTESLSGKVQPALLSAPAAVAVNPSKPLNLINITDD